MVIGKWSSAGNKGVMARTHRGLYVWHDYHGRRIVARCRVWPLCGRFPVRPIALWENNMVSDEKTRTELEAAVFRRLVQHLRERTDVQNIDLMNLAGFCRNCLSNWMKDAADAKGLPMSRDESREIVYGMPFDEWRAKYQNEASPQQKAAFEKSSQKH
jgi:uncharacterized protein